MYPSLINNFHNLFIYIQDFTSPVNLKTLRSGLVVGFRQGLIEEGRLVHGRLIDVGQERGRLPLACHEDVAEIAPSSCQSRCFPGSEGLRREELWMWDLELPQEAPQYLDEMRRHSTPKFLSYLLVHESTLSQMDNAEPWILLAGARPSQQ